MWRFGSIVVFGLGCSDYDLHGKEEAEGADAKDTGNDDREVDTADDPEDSGDTGGDTSTDTGEPDPEIATEAIYINSGSTLYSFDPATGRATQIGIFKDAGVTVSDMTDIAIDLTGRMVGVAYTELYSITPATAEVSWIGTLDDSCNGLTFVSDGTLVAAGDGGVITIDTGTLQQSKLGGRTYTSSGDIVGLPDGFLYWSVRGTANDVMVRVDPTNGTTVELGDIGTGGVFALGYAYGELYGFTSAEKVIIIDATTGRTVSTDRLSGTWWGATTNPVLW